MWGNNMKAKLNIPLFETMTFDSGSLGVLAMVLHQFSSPGYYRTSIMKQDCTVGEVDFEVNEKSEVMQLDIDLAQVNWKTKLKSAGLGFKSGIQNAGIVSPKGYVLFHVSSGSGYSAMTSEREGRAAFNSATLQDGDLFAVSLLEPAGYTMKNVLGSATGGIVVTLTSKAAKSIKTLETCHIDVNQKKFNPERVELTASQGLVFHVKDSARILIEMKRAKVQKHAKPAIRWQKLKTAKR